MTEEKGELCNKCMEKLEKQIKRDEQMREARRRYNEKIKQKRKEDKEFDELVRLKQRTYLKEYRNR